MMGTNPIPKGTCNFPVNLPVVERQELGRLAYARGARSIGAFVRGLIEHEIGVAKRGGLFARQAGQLTLDLCFVVVAGIGLGLVLGSALSGNDNLRRVRGGRRNGVCAVRVVRGRRESV